MRRIAFALAVALIALAGLPASALGAFGLHGFDVTFTEAGGSPDTEAGSHPFEMTTRFEANTTEAEGKVVPDEQIKDVAIAQIPGFVGAPTVVPRCSTVDFLTVTNADTSVPECADASAVGKVETILAPPEEAENSFDSPVYLLEPSPGTAARLGFWVKGIPVIADVGVSESPPYNVIGASRNISQLVNFYGAELILWGDPASELHNKERGACYPGGKKQEEEPGASCPAGIAEAPFLTLPRACTGPLASSFATDSWQHPGRRLANGMPDPNDPNWVTGSAETHDELGNPEGMSGCGKLLFGPEVSAQPSTDQASSPSGLTVDLNVKDEGLTNPKGTAQSDIGKVVVSLPEGMTLNPSVAEGLVACSEADLARETLASEAGEGCPEASKVGTVEVTTPLLPETLFHGALYVATPFENPAHSLIALYMVVKEPERGVIVKQVGKVEPDPKTGQIVTTFDELPQFPLGHVEVRLRVGGRSPLITPPSCGTFDTVAKLTPTANPSSVLESTSSFQITRGVGGAPCPPAGTLPFSPGFTAGTLDNHGGAFSPFFMRLTRPDGNQDLTRFDATLPPGVTAKLAGVAECSDADIAAARRKTGREEQLHPSCPANSQIGRVEGGAGVGSELTYVPGKLYLAGPTNGAPLSVVAIVPAVAGPFDVGNVVVRQALRVNPRTGVASADSAASDAIPHSLAGIPLAVRDIRVYVDRPNFTLNPTGCLASGTQASIWGGGLDPFSAADDAPVPRFAPFQAASCASLPFKPALSLNLNGGTRRGAFPKFSATYRPRPGDANVNSLVLQLPRSEFVEQGHFRTICTRVQYAASQCPAGSVYGYAIARTPLLDQPLEGPVILRSSNHNLPDVVFVLHGRVDAEVAVRIDSIKGKLRATVEEAPDLPVSEVLVEMQGGQKGLIVNSTNLCTAKHRAGASLIAHNAATLTEQPAVRASGCKGHRRKHHQRHRRKAAGR
jgi:hypothetical protein